MATTATAPVQLYTLDCGRIEITDFGSFTDSGKPVGKGKTLADPCYLIKHPKGTLLWDTGLEESISQSKEGVANPVGREFVDASLREQLAALSLKPADITYVSFSHMHGDHAGNAKMFEASTWLVNRAEVAAAAKSPPPIGVKAEVAAEVPKVKSKLLDGDEDVFGDGTVRILQTPGHTAGHQSLYVKLAKSGPVVLSGDLAHSRENWEKHVVPAFNASHDNTIASMKRIEGILKSDHARFIVQHSKEDFDAMPKFPAYLE
ncbi:AttM/AiiB family protein [Labilithrix luteola]|uniref:AttM/AiiB family protein n=1 Tax=Labilithrix luteola TaxID=1391654 RepID=A0A0K1Q490_9BACT|nr:AttM/AiiB family protein [Labilithrix luteola]